VFNTPRLVAALSLPSLSVSPDWVSCFTEQRDAWLEEQDEINQERKKKGEVTPHRTHAHPQHTIYDTLNHPLLYESMCYLIFVYDDGSRKGSITI